MSSASSSQSHNEDPRREPFSVSQRISALAWPAKTIVRRLLGEVFYQKARVRFFHEHGGVGLDWKWGNSPRRVHPIRRDFGWQSGQPIDRYYTEEHFLPAYQPDIRGRVLEIGDDRYTRQFGKEHVTVSDVLHVNRHKWHHHSG